MQQEIMGHDYMEVQECSKRMAIGTLEVTLMILLATCRLVLTVQMHLPGISGFILASHGSD